MVRLTLSTLMVMGSGVGIISSWAHSDSLVRVLERRLSWVLDTDMVMEPLDTREIFSARGMSRSGGKDDKAWAGSRRLWLSSLSLKTPCSGPDNVLSDQLLPDWPNLRQ